MDDDVAELYRLKLQRRRRLYLYASFLLCVTSIALVCASLGTQYWMTSKLDNFDNENSYGNFHAGLFGGVSFKNNSLTTLRINYTTVCDEGYCLYSCAKTEQERYYQLHMILDGRGSELSDCLVDGVQRTKQNQQQSVQSSVETDGSAEACKLLSLVNRSLPNAAHNVFMTLFRNLAKNCSKSVSSADDNSEPSDEFEFYRLESHARKINDTEGTNDTDGLMNEAMWASTIAFLALGLVFALVGSVFAIVNTATTPVEAITGITGLYIWNGVAAACDLIAVSLWAGQFNNYLNSNVLVVESNQGWTTEGAEQLGYSFWLVVVAIIIHVANCGVIAFGTREPKAKETIQEPDKVTNDILLY